MNKIKTGIVAVAATATAIITFRTIRNRRKTPQEETEQAIEETHAELESATEHATAAAGHARVAVDKTLERFREGREKAEEITAS